MNNNRRAFEGTAPALVAGVKIGDAFEVKENGSAEFIKARVELFEALRAEALKRESGDGKEIECRVMNGSGAAGGVVGSHKGVAGLTTPGEVAAALKIKGVLAARVSYHDESCLTGVCANDAFAEIQDDVSEEGEEDEKSVLWDLNRALKGSCDMTFLKFDDADGKHIFWHSCAHLLGLALEQRFGGKVTIGPALQNGFYYDAYLGDKLSVSETHYEELERAARQATATGAPFERLDVSKADAMALFAENPFKLAIINAKVPEGTPTSVYRCGNFIDLCMGPHVPHLGWLKAFKIEKHSAAYWLGDAKGDSLQRIYGIGFPDVKLLKEYERRVEEAKKRDHRVLGQKLGYFFFEPIYSPGSAFWTPLGSKIYQKLCDFIRYEYRFRGFSEVTTPNLCSSDLFKVSGHWQNYKDSMFTMDVEGKQWALKPMNCPTHCCIFKNMKLSYKQLPIRMADFGVLHRNEFSGSLSGLTRVRRFQQDDAHIFCELSQIQQEVASALEFLTYVYAIFGFEFKLCLSTRPKKALGDLALWNQAESDLAAALNASGMPWTLKKGDGAFYGPKIDVKLFDALGRGHQCGTIQLDFQMPLRFDLQYKTAEQQPSAADDTADAQSAPADSAGAPGPAPAAADQVGHASGATGSKMLKVVDGSLESELKFGNARPVMIHRAILGSVERMTAVILEHYGGKLPFWLSPRQALVCPISEKSGHYARWVATVLQQQGFDAECDVSNTTINKKIREASLYQWNYMLVVGEKEEQSRTVMLRARENPQQQQEMSVPDVVSLFSELRDVAGRRSMAIPEYVPPKAAA